MNQSFAKLCFNILGIAVVTAYSSCKPENLRDGAQKEYFDLKGYFEQRIAQLTKQNGIITKTVAHNGATETKKVEIGDWKTELGMFIESDINKPAWQGSYMKKDSAGATIYTAVDDDLKTRKLMISKAGDGKVKQIFIYNEVNNALYTAREELSYYADSAYIIKKYQKVKLLGANTYKITGKF